MLDEDNRRLYQETVESLLDVENAESAILIIQEKIESDIEEDPDQFTVKIALASNDGVYDDDFTDNTVTVLACAVAQLFLMVESENGYTTTGGTKENWTMMNEFNYRVDQMIEVGRAQQQIQKAMREQH